VATLGRQILDDSLCVALGCQPAASQPVTKNAVIQCDVDVPVPNFDVVRTRRGKAGPLVRLAIAIGVAQGENAAISALSDGRIDIAIGRHRELADSSDVVRDQCGAESLRDDQPAVVRITGRSLRLGRHPEEREPQDGW
jgi:hypothetical protein